MNLITINAHSSIRIENQKIVYFDPFKIEEESHDADIIFITHSHFDHYSIEDIKKIEKDNTIFVIPESIQNEVELKNVICVKPNENISVLDIPVEVIHSYNPNKQFHPKEKEWVGYVVTIENERIYVAGDTDCNQDILQIKCDVALVPIGGKFTMDYKEAADFINQIKPKIAIPTHYGAVAGSKDDGRFFKELVNKEIEVQIKI